jgi:type II secretory pathway pseudopilin PulG
MLGGMANLPLSVLVALGVVILVVAIWGAAVLYGWLYRRRLSRESEARLRRIQARDLREYERRQDQRGGGR